MDIRDRRTALPGVQFQQHPSGYFSDPTPDLDPRLFNGETFRPDVRAHLLSMFEGFWRPLYAGPHHWSTVWVAGSGVSHQWSAQRDPGDLDILVGVDFTTFRSMNPRYQDWPDVEIADEMNIQFRRLNAETASWNGFEVTWYVNPNSADIRNISPYAAYNLSQDEWTVHPIEIADGGYLFPEAYWSAAAAEHEQAADIVQRYNDANMVGGVNGGFRARMAAQQAKALFDAIHVGRHEAFRPGGGGYADYANFRWQVHKRSGVVAALKELAATIADPTAPASAAEALREAVRHVQQY
jgi:hypothetical protein